MKVCLNVENTKKRLKRNLKEESFANNGEDGNGL